MLYTPLPEPGATGPLKILAFVHSFEPGGVERVALRLCKIWKDSGADVTLLVGRRDGALRDDAPDVKQVTYSSGPISTSSFETFWMIVCMWRLLRANRPDVIFCPGNTYTVVIAAIRILFGRRCPPVICKVSNSFHRSDMPAPLRIAYGLWLRSHKNLAQVWIAMATSLQGEVVTSLGVPIERVAVVEDPSLSDDEIEEHARARDQGAPRSRPGRLLLSVGRLVPQKRFDLLIRAFCKGAGDDDRLVILGDGPRRASLQKLIRTLGATGRIRLLGHSRDVTAWLGRADLLLLASDYEGLPAVLVEALAAGVPIVATRSSAAIDELAGHGRFGQVVPCNDERALARAIGKALMPEFPRREAREMAERFTVERAAPAYLQLMGDAIKRPATVEPLGDVVFGIEASAGMVPASAVSLSTRT